MGILDKILDAFRSKPTPPAPPPSLGPAERLLAHIATDKPVYKPGERVYARAALLDAFTRVPSEDIDVYWEVRGARGDKVFQGDTRSELGVAALSWDVPKEQPGGEYTLALTFNRTGDAPAELTFAIRSYRVPRLKTDIDFARKAYGPGDIVSATLSVTRAEGGFPEGAKVTAVATVDGAEVSRGELTLDARGRCAATFELPRAIRDGEGTLVMIVRDGGVQETAAKTIPIVVNRVNVELFPEGGDLVAGLVARLYFEARTPKGKPADIAGRVIDGDGAVIARFRSEHEGRGRVEFTPTKPGKAYALALDEPAGVTDLYPLPEVQREGFALRALADAYRAGRPVKLSVASTGAGEVRVILSQRERELASYPVDLRPGEAQEVVLTPPQTADGVLRATLFDAEGLPRAERLVFLRPTRELTLEVSASPSRAGLRDKVEVTIKARDEKNQPAVATVSLAAVDDAVLETIERRERAPRLPVQCLLGSDVRELFDAQVYLAGGDEAPMRTDLLLGTQGWRRFAFYRIEDFVTAHGDKAERALARRRPVAPMPPPQALRGGFGAPPGAPRQGMAPMPRPAAAPAPMRLAMPVPKPAPMPAPAVEAVAQALPVDALLGDDLEMAKEVFADEAPAEAPIAQPIAKPIAQPIVAPGFAPGFAPAPGAPPPPPGFRAQAPLPSYVPVREFAHRAPETSPEHRTDFAETLYWNASVRTDEKGVARVEFALCDSVTTFRVRADGFSGVGALGEGDATVEARRPFYLEPKLPLEVTAGDVIELPVAAVNGTARSLEAELSVVVVEPITARGETSRRLSLSADERARARFELSVGSGMGAVPVRVRSSGARASDDVTRSVEVVPAGFPMALSAGGRLGDGAVHALTIPDEVEPGSLVTELVVYATPLASLVRAVEALLREPCGCFEQTSSSNYPNVMVMQYLASHTGVAPELAKRASDLLERGYQRLVGYECKEKGYEWWGGDRPAHEALTAYGVMEFTDMAKVFAVDGAMLDRTRQWLLSKRDGKGGFVRNSLSLDTFGGAPQDVTDAYITWALSQSRVQGIEAEVARVRTLSRESTDPYILALAANVLLDVGDEAATAAMQRLAEKQGDDGALRGANTSITRSGGESLVLETTSLAILAWLRAPSFSAQCARAMEFVLSACKGGRFGATQSTILALKAIVAWDASQASPGADGVARVMVDGRLVASAQFTADQSEPVVFPTFASALTAGDHRVSVEVDGGSAMPYSLQVRYNARTPLAAAGCKVRLATALARDEVREGEAVDLEVGVVNISNDDVPMTVAIVGLPGGLETRPDQLKELVKESKVDFIETRGRDVVLYFRGLSAGARKVLTLSLVAAVPGRYTGAASRAYLYYTDEEKHWVSPLAVRVVASA